MDNLLSETEQLIERMDLLELEHQSLQEHVRSQNDKMTTLLSLSFENMQGIMDIIKAQSPNLEEE